VTFINTIKSKLSGNGASANAFFSLLNKGINAIVPLLFIPLCNNLFGVEAYGRMVFYQSLVGLIITFSDYGFSVTGLKVASINSNNPSAISKLFSEISFIKIVLLFIGGIALYFYLITTDSKFTIKRELLLFLFVLGSLSLQSLLPYWLYQGLKKNKTIAVINLFSKLLLLLLTVFFVLNSKYIFSVALVELLSYLFALAICLFLLFKQYQLKIQIPKANEVKRQLTFGFNYFIIELIYWSINGGSVLIVEKYVSSFELGYYGIFLRFSYYAFAIFQPIILSLIPFYIEKFTNSFQDGIDYYKKVFYYFFFSALIGISTIGFFLKNILDIAFSKEIVSYFQNHQIIPYTFLSWIFLFLINNFTANSVLLSNHKEVIYRNSQLANGITVIILFFILVPKFGSLGACLAMLFGQIVFFVSIFKHTYKFLLFKYLILNTGKKNQY